MDSKILKGYLKLNRFVFFYNSVQRVSRYITFNIDGSIGEGKYYPFECYWKITDNSKLELLDKDKSVFGRFTYVYELNKFISFNESDTSNFNAQYIEAVGNVKPALSSTVESIQQSNLELEYNQIFLSYSSKDSEYANHLKTIFNKFNIKFFQDDKDINYGEDFSEVIRKALIGAVEVWILISENSINSEWVTTEWGVAWALNKKIMPILLNCSINHLPLRLRKLKAINFNDVDKYLSVMINANSQLIHPPL